MSLKPDTPVLPSNRVAVACGPDRYEARPPFSPAVAWPEYPFAGAGLAGANGVYDTVRESLRLLGLDPARTGTPQWNPLGDLIAPGQTVVLKPNFVRNFRETQPGDGDCLVTHGAVIRAVLDYAYLALAGRGRLIIADAPQNDADFDALRRLAGLDEIQAFYRQHAGFKVEVYDLRPERAEKKNGVIVGHVPLPGDPAGYVKVDLGACSAFAEIGPLCRRLYGSEYDTRELRRHHHDQVHEYLISKTVLSADCIINLPKLKTHKKTGLTVGLKNLVGINGNKNWLPHHREGTPAQGGDQFADDRLLRRLECLAVAAFKRVFPFLGPLRRRLAAPAKSVGKQIFGDTNTDTIRSGNWHGNDTTWRMAHDLNRILLYADAAGRWHDQPTHRLLNLVDGIVGGEGNGPLDPTPKPVGLILAGFNPVAVDLVAARLMGFDYRRLPIVARAFDQHPRPLISGPPEDVVLCSNHERFNQGLAGTWSSESNFRPHFGWPDCRLTLPPPTAAQHKTVAGAPPKSPAANPDAADCAQYFDSLADRWTALYQSKVTFRDRLKVFASHLTKLRPPPAKLLDYGCGSGNMALAFAGLGYDVTGVDFAARMVETAERERQRRGLTNASFLRLESLSWTPQSFDVIVCSSVLEYVDDDDALLLELSALLKPAGLLLLSVPTTASLLGKIEDALDRLPLVRKLARRECLAHSKRRYRLPELAGLLNRADLKPLQRTFFEVPLLGRPGVPLSRLAWLGIMVLLTAQKTGPGPMPPVAQPRRPAAVRAFSRKNLWEMTPALLKRLGRGLLRPGLPWVLGRNFRRHRRMAAAAERFPAARSQDYQLEQLRRICELAFRRSSYYRAAFLSAGFAPDDLRTLADLRRLALIDRHAVRARLEEMCTVPPRGFRIDYAATGGTGGEPLHFYIGANRSAVEYAYLVTSWQRAGYRLGLPLAVLRGRVVRPDRRGLYHEYDPLLRHHYYSNFHMTDENMGRYLEHIATLGPCFLHVYPSSVAALARFIRRTGAKAPANVRGIIAESEIVYPDQRKMAEEVFGCRYFSCYGHSEKLVLAAECEFSTDYHVWPTYGYFELLDDDGNPVTTPGRRGEIVGTGFINTVMPFIRYRTGDYATYVGDHCAACGRQHTIIRDIRGHRTQEMLVAADGAEISWTALNLHDDTFARVRQFQFYQDAPGKAVLKLIPADGFGETDGRAIQRSLGRKFDGRLEFTIQTVDAIPLTPRGKTVYVDQRLARNASDGPPSEDVLNQAAP